MFPRSQTDLSRINLRQFALKRDTKTRLYPLETVSRRQVSLLFIINDKEKQEAENMIRTRVVHIVSRRIDSFLVCALPKLPRPEVENEANFQANVEGYRTFWDRFFNSCPRSPLSLAAEKRRNLKCTTHIG